MAKQDDFRLLLQFEVDYNYYTSERTQRRLDNFHKNFNNLRKKNYSVGSLSFRDQKTISEDTWTYLYKKLRGVITDNFFQLKRLLMMLDLNSLPHRNVVAVYLFA